jgi:hypothetical protein
MGLCFLGTLSLSKKDPPPRISGFSGNSSSNLVGKLPGTGFLLLALPSWAKMPEK